MFMKMKEKVLLGYTYPILKKIVSVNFYTEFFI